MLVLSRGRNDKVVFPTLGINIEILRIEGKKVRLGIDAPKSLPIMRSEIVEQATVRPSPTGGLTHSMRNRLQKATVGLRILQRLLDADRADEAEPTIFRIFNDSAWRRRQVNPPGSLQGDLRSYTATSPLRTDGVR
jgi:carbon storage regulator CsrA